MSSKKIILNTNKNFEIIDITSQINREIDIDFGIVVEETFFVGDSF